MRRQMIHLTILILTLLPGAGMSQVVWERQPANIVLDVGVPGSWDDLHVCHPSVLFQGGGYHLWYTGQNGSRQGIGYAKSADGMIWERCPGNPVLEDGIGDAWDGVFVSQPSVVYDGIGYRMWYAGYDGTNLRIGYATSVDGVAWEKHAANPVLDLGAGGAWDGEGVSGPSVVYDGVGYRMWYVGYDGVRMRIGYATSVDGVAWEKHAANPVLDLGAGGVWDGEGVSGPTVVLAGELLGRSMYRMWYVGYDGVGMRIGYAMSSDGAIWEKHTANPVLDPGEEGSWDGEGVSGPTVVQTGSMYRMWYTGYDGAQMRIGYTTSEMPGDPSGDGTISAYDAALVLRYVVGNIDEFPAQQLSTPKGVQALSRYRVSVPEISAQAGDRVEVPLRIKDATGLFAGGIRLVYDPTMLRVVEVSGLDLLSGSYWQVNAALEGEVRLAFATSNPLREGGDLFALTLEVLGDTEGRETPLMLSEVTLNDAVPVERRHGSVRVLPLLTRLLPNYPNPFNPETWIPYQLSEDAYVRIGVYDAVGQLIRVLDLGERGRGVYLEQGRAAYWDGKDASGDEVSSGIYQYRLEVGGVVKLRSMALVR